MPTSSRRSPKASMRSLESSRSSNTSNSTRSSGINSVSRESISHNELLQKILEDLETSSVQSSQTDNSDLDLLNSGQTSEKTTISKEQANNFLLTSSESLLGGISDYHRELLSDPLIADQTFIEQEEHDKRQAIEEGPELAKDITLGEIDQAILEQLEEKNTVPESEKDTDIEFEEIDPKILHALDIKNTLAAIKAISQDSNTFNKMFIENNRLLEQKQDPNIYLNEVMQTKIELLPELKDLFSRNLQANIGITTPKKARAVKKRPVSVATNRVITASRPYEIRGPSPYQASQLNAVMRPSVSRRLTVTIDNRTKDGVKIPPNSKKHLIIDNRSPYLQHAPRRRKFPK